MNSIYSGISCNLDHNVLTAALPLFKEGSIEALEWSFDALFNHKNIPSWFKELLQFYGNEGRLIGHGVYYSLFSGKMSPEQKEWLKHLESTSKQYNFDHISEHFGFMTGADFHKGAPLSVPYSSDALNVAKDRIARMSVACQKPVGLENLAFCYSIDEVEKHGRYLKDILSEINGFIILDLHNIYCQVKNFDIPFKDLIQLYPLEMVREIHISGGSWENSQSEADKKIRRDTHDEAVPEEVFEYLKLMINQLPNLKFVILEQLGTGLTTDKHRLDFRSDFKRMKKICASANSRNEASQNSFLPDKFIQSEIIYESDQLAKEQQILTGILEDSTSLNEAKKELENSMLSQSSWQIENWDHSMLETAYEITQKWKHGF